MSIVPFKENCYICLSNDNNEDRSLIKSPCSCKLHIHAKCLYRFIEMSRKVACTICRDVYSISLINDDKVDCKDRCNLITSIKDDNIKRVSSIRDVYETNYRILHIMAGLGDFPYQ